MKIIIFNSIIHYLIRKNPATKQTWRQRQLLGDLSINIQKQSPQRDPREQEYFSLPPTAQNSSKSNI